MPRIVFALTGLLTLLIACSAPDAPGSDAAQPVTAMPSLWTIEPDTSSIAFSTFKTVGFSQHLGGMEASVMPDMVGETHHFSGLSGTYSADGQVAVSIPLDTIRTGFDIRDVRMREFLFETETYPVAVISASIAPGIVEKIEIGDLQTIPLSFTVSLHGIEIGYDTEVTVSRLADDRVMVSSENPIIVNSGDFDLIPGVDKLRELASLPAISPVVTVNFQLVFTGRVSPDD